MVGWIQDMELKVSLGKPFIQRIHRRSKQIVDLIPVNRVGDEPEVDAELFGVRRDPQLARDRLVSDDLGEGAANFESTPLPGGS
jgi:hypothetical protein